MEKVYSVSQLKSTLFPLFRDYGVRKALAPMARGQQQKKVMLTYW